MREVCVEKKRDGTDIRPSLHYIWCHKIPRQPTITLMLHL